MMNSTTFTMLLLMMWNFTHVLSGNSVGTNATSTNNTDLLIVGGSKAPRYSHDFVVGLRRLESSKNLCGGALIAPRVVLTAAHCVASPSRKLYASIGSKYVNGQDGQVIRVLHQIRHPNWSSLSKKFDIAVLILETSARFEPIALDRSSTIRAGTSVRVFGWGLQKENKGGMAYELRQVKLPIVDNHDCQEKINEAIMGWNIHSSQLCAGGKKGRDSCQGDSGGPLVLYDTKIPTLVGIVSFGIGCGRANLPGVYSRIEYIHDWILSTMGDFGLSME